MVRCVVYRDSEVWRQSFLATYAEFWIGLKLLATALLAVLVMAILFAVTRFTLLGA